MHNMLWLSLRLFHSRLSDTKHAAIELEPFQKKFNFIVVRVVTQILSLQQMIIIIIIITFASYSHLIVFHDYRYYCILAELGTCLVNERFHFVSISLQCYVLTVRSIPPANLNLRAHSIALLFFFFLIADLKVSLFLSVVIMHIIQLLSLNHYMNFLLLKYDFVNFHQITFLFYPLSHAHIIIQLSWIVLCDVFLSISFQQKIS